ncbi:hypothetical protein Prudu_839S000400 [Prunus dulcis]|uniref:Uncharacterized protein n=1 Tax=Prunus dulcis TaxID=3755 RepID=A0A5H2XMF0_PRUDU|nr:hypothetical protein Prudu_839S000400 [Prunus dulcis]
MSWPRARWRRRRRPSERRTPCCAKGGPGQGGGGAEEVEGRGGGCCPSRGDRVLPNLRGAEELHHDRLVDEQLRWEDRLVRFNPSVEINFDTSGEPPAQVSC